MQLSPIQCTYSNIFIRFFKFFPANTTFTKIHTGYPAQTALLKSHCRGGNAHFYACLRLFLRVVCFILDQTIVASDKCLSYARILLFPTGTQYPVGAHYTVSCVGFIIWFPSGGCVVCFSFDQPTVANNSRLSYACILLFPTGTKYPAGSPYFRSQ